jgi:hypothetical protein|tara:strand:- start:1029 stop:1490 length:462 start_codon:yes stop_codon:yes gene_type:complete
MKPRLYDIINTFDKTSKQLNERAESNVDLRVAMTQQTQKNSVSVQQYKIEVVQEKFGDKRKNFYNIYEHDELIHKDIALFESAMGIVKNLLSNKIQKANDIEKADMQYNNALYEVYMFKSRAKVKSNEDVMLAKMSNAKQKMAEAKSKIMQKL